MRLIVVLLVAALVLTPTLAHATVPSGEGFVVLALAVVVLGKFLIDAAKRHAAAPEIPSTAAGEPSAAESSSTPAPADGR
jgi:hypothetical protein